VALFELSDALSNQPRLIPEKFMTGRLSQMLMPCSTLRPLKGYWHVVVFDIKGIIMETTEVPIIT
jgi:hypothetical protein